MERFAIELLARHPAYRNFADWALDLKSRDEARDLAFILSGIDEPMAMMLMEAVGPPKEG